MEELALIGSLLNKEEPIVEQEPEQENEEEYQVEEPMEKNLRSIYCGISI